MSPVSLSAAPVMTKTTSASTNVTLKSSELKPKKIFKKVTTMVGSFLGTGKTSSSQVSTKHPYALEGLDEHLEKLQLNVDKELPFPDVADKLNLANTRDISTEAHTEVYVESPVLSSADHSVYSDVRPTETYTVLILKTGWREVYGNQLVCVAINDKG
ncbi:hypothetical protein HK096_005158 [Nowakowskiella sp. JEL0078]|nr:hypothetical protein HK096_005158 [Nowakowskiella sp. JEL0078]